MRHKEKDQDKNNPQMPPFGAARKGRRG